MKFLEEKEFLVGQVEDSRVGGWCSVKNGGRPGAWTLLVPNQWIHADMAILDWSPVDMVR